MSDTSAELILRLRSNADHDAWGRFVEWCEPLLLRRAGKMGFAGEEAADLVQDVFVRLLERLPEFEYQQNRGEFLGWLWTMLRNAAVDRHRRLRRRRETRIDSHFDHAAPDSRLESDEAEARRHAVGRALRLLRERLRPKTWRCVWLSVAEGMPAPEVAARLGITVGAVYVAKGRALARLRKDLNHVLANEKTQEKLSAGVRNGARKT